MRKINQRTYTKEEKERVLKLHLQHKNDVAIHKITGFGYGFIQQQTTKYWKDKVTCAKQLQDKSEGLT